jgi:hypothetical protein
MNAANRTRNTAGRFRCRFIKLKRLNEEALKKVDENAASIVGFLYTSVEKGGVISARLLFELAEGSVEAEEAMFRRPLRSLANALANDEPWPGEVDEAKAETGSGGNEPE